MQKTIISSVTMVAFAMIRIRITRKFKPAVSLWLKHSSESLVNVQLTTNRHSINMVNFSPMTRCANGTSYTCLFQPYLMEPRIVMVPQPSVGITAAIMKTSSQPKLFDKWMRLNMRMKITKSINDANIELSIITSGPRTSDGLSITEAGGSCIVCCQMPGLNDGVGRNAASRQ